MSSVVTDFESGAASPLPIRLIFLVNSLDAPETLVLASGATLALVPRFKTRRHVFAIKLRLSVTEGDVRNTNL